jgi:hypothetical protein
MTGPSVDPTRVMLRHTVATLAYRAAKALRGAPPSFATYQVGPTSRTPAQVLAHMGDLLDWALQLTNGKYVYVETSPQAWDADCARFFAALSAFDARLADPTPLGYSAEVLFQGPIADALQHTGQLTMLRRLAGSPVRGESYAKAEILVGRVGAEQPPPRREFD